jgi:molybdate transport system ATP-binding protein
MTPPMVWDIALRKLLWHGETRFALDVQFTSAAKRVVLHGPSGAGKSQTLRMIAGITKPDAGRVVVAGQVLCDTGAGLSLSPQQRRLAFVFQDYALFPHLTVRQNIAFALSMGWRNPSRTAQDPRVDHWLRSFGLQAHANHHPHQISGGQRQRTALARALVSQPTALLLDEPFAALDKSLRQSLRQELKELQIELQLPLLLITHDEDDIDVLAEDVVQLVAGQVTALPAACDTTAIARLASAG